MSALVTPELLLALCPTLPPERAEITAVKLEVALRRFEIIVDDDQVSRNRVAHILSQLCHESGLEPKEERLNYSAKRLREVWPNRFTEVLAEQCAGNPQMIANVAYGGRLGNVEPGDGFRYAGKGLIQLTGRANYLTYGKLIGFDLVRQPELLLEVGVSCLVAAAYFAHHGGGKGKAVLDSGYVNAVDSVTLFVNGGQNGLEGRKAYYRQAAALLGVVQPTIILPTPLRVEDIPALPLPKAGQFYYPVPLGPDLDHGYNTSVGGYKDDQYYVEVKTNGHGSAHTGQDFNINRRPHEGVDKEYGKPYGAMYHGKIISVKHHRVWGWITLQHCIDPEDDTPFWFQYAHSKEVLVKEGQFVNGGQVIGTIGKGGQNHLPAHLHGEKRRYGPPALPDDFWPSSKYATKKAAYACVDRNYDDLMAFLKRRGAINPTF